MIKEDNDWKIDYDSEMGFHVTINEVGYDTTSNMAALIHSILLLVDAINDKKL